MEGVFEDFEGVGKFLLCEDDFENVLVNCLMKESGGVFEFVLLLWELVKLCEELCEIGDCIRC